MIHHLRALAARLRGLFGDRRAERELDKEIETHLRLLTERYVRQGMTEDARAARRQFGNVTLLPEVNRELLGGPERRYERGWRDQESEAQ